MLVCRTSLDTSTDTPTAVWHITDLRLMPGDLVCEFSCGNEKGSALWEYRWKWPFDEVYSGRKIVSCSTCLEKHLGHMGWFHMAMLRARHA